MFQEAIIVRSYQHRLDQCHRWRSTYSSQAAASLLHWGKNPCDPISSGFPSQPEGCNATPAAFFSKFQSNVTGSSGLNFRSLKFGLKGGPNHNFLVLTNRFFVRGILTILHWSQKLRKNYPECLLRQSLTLLVVLLHRNGL